MTTYPFTAGGLAAALAALGDTPDAVAETLLAGGYRGTRGADCDCPVAVYLLSEFPEAVRAYVWTDPPNVELRRAFGTFGTSIWSPLPAPVLSFVDAFDLNGAYDDLNLDAPVDLAC